MLARLDIFDPNTWEPPLTTRRLFLSDRDDSLFATIDAADYEWAARHLWAADWSKPRPGRPRKAYAVRVQTIRLENGRRGDVKLYLHKEVLLRHRGAPPAGFEIGDHRDGDSLNCTLANLRWATASMNRKNLHGACGRDLLEAAE